MSVAPLLLLGLLAFSKNAKGPQGSTPVRAFKIRGYIVVFEPDGSRITILAPAAVFQLVPPDSRIVMMLGDPKAAADVKAELLPVLKG